VNVYIQYICLLQQWTDNTKYYNTLQRALAEKQKANTVVG